MNPIVTLQFGSHLYGTNTPKSDKDFKQVYIPEGKALLLQNTKAVLTSHSKKDNTAKNSAEDVDTESIALQKYLNLVMEGQTVALDMLFAPSWAEVGSTSWVWREIQANKDKLLSKRYMSFVGYCRTQANKYGIKGSRMADTRAVVELLTVLVEDLKQGNEPLRHFDGYWLSLQEKHPFVRVVDQLDKSTGQMSKYLEVCNRKTPYNASVKTALQCYQKLYDEYGARARAAENNEGIDWKALSHAVRIGQQAVELLSTGSVVFPRANFRHLLDIKTGQLPYALVADEIERLLVQIELEASRSSLPDSPDEQWVNDFVERHHYEAISFYYRRKEALKGDTNSTKL